MYNTSHSESVQPTRQLKITVSKSSCLLMCLELQSINIYIQIYHAIKKKEMVSCRMVEEKAVGMW